MAYTESQKAQFETDGYIVLPGLLTAEEITRLREASKAHLHAHAVFVDGGTTQMDAFNHVPEVRWLPTHPKVLEAFHYFCGDQLEYCHHSDIHMNKFTGWHRDNHGKNDWAPGADGQPFAVYKMAAYLQDHSRGPTALYVVPGSHRTNADTGAPVAELRPAIGDVVLFDIRIKHKGEENSLFGKILKRISPSRALTTRILQGMRSMQGAPEKMSVFFTYGLPNERTREHVDLTIERQLRQSGEQKYELANDLRSQLTDAGIIVRDKAA